MADSMKINNPDKLTGERLVGRVEGDAIQLVGFVREYGPDAIHQLFDAWGEQHLRRVCIALAAAVKDYQTPQELWGWLGEVSNLRSTTVPTHELWTVRDPLAPSDHDIAAQRGTRRAVSPEVRERMAERGRRLHEAKARKHERSA
jgi:hypothetical protein